jgi:hypothetical protein
MTKKMVRNPIYNIVLSQMEINGYLIMNQDIPKVKPFRPSGETNILPGCGSPCRKPWINIISANTSTSAFATYNR